MSNREEEKERLKALKCAETDPINTHGVLLSDEIEYYVKNFDLIRPFSQSNLKASAYKLSIGDEYAIGGEMKTLTFESSNIIKIPAFQVAVIKTEETINLPRFLIGRWNIRVNLAYEGLLWVGGPQVDAGYVGHLYCPIYNLSDKEVTLRRGDTIAIIDFAKTTPFKKGVCKEYQRPPEYVLFSDYHPEKLKSALYTEAQLRIEKTEKKVDKFVSDLEEKVNVFGQRLDTSIGIIFAAISILVAALAIFVGSGDQVKLIAPGWLYLTVGFSIISLILSITAFAKPKKGSYPDQPGGDLNPRILGLEKTMASLKIALAILFIIIAILFFILLGGAWLQGVFKF